MDGNSDDLTNKLARGWVGLQDVRLDDVLARGALLLSHAESVSKTLPFADGMVNRFSRLLWYFQHAHFIPIVGVGKRGEY